MGPRVAESKCAQSRSRRLLAGLASPLRLLLDLLQPDPLHQVEKEIRALWDVPRTSAVEQRLKELLIERRLLSGQPLDPYAGERRETPWPTWLPPPPEFPELSFDDPPC